MRQMVQRFFAAALAIAMLAGTVGTVSAQNQDSDSITATSTTVAALRITVTNREITFPQLDAYGLNETPAGVTKCGNLDTATSTTYASNTITTVNVKSTTGYNIISAAASGDEDDFVIFLGNQCSPDRLTFDQADRAAGDPGQPDPRLSGSATGRDGTDYKLYVGAVIRVNEELVSTSTLSFTMRASAVAPTTPAN